MVDETQKANLDHEKYHGDNSKEIQKKNSKDDDSDAWVTFLDTLHIPNYVEESKDYFRIEFAKFVKWLYEEHFNLKDKEYPPKLPNGCAIELFDLYMHIEEAGGYKKASKAIGSRPTFPHCHISATSLFPIAADDELEETAKRKQRFKTILYLPPSIHLQTFGPPLFLQMSADVVRRL
ncbi:hypothetical protein E3N88_29274 [Mikania micrantha]|uniref:ARID domain-containing protein n=1 Tax=Mikania micrantha TaxID=192012 RepID=A0A5N6MIB8_9ASTR|nr:hypothetical protein E3N88_29274 [Mikania micrantha]